MSEIGAEVLQESELKEAGSYRTMRGGVEIRTFCLTETLGLSRRH